MSVARSTLGYASRLSRRDAPVLTRMRELSAQYPRYGYRFVRIFLERDGFMMSFGRAHRLCASFAQIDDREPSMSKSDSPIC